MKIKTKLKQKVSPYIPHKVLIIASLEKFQDLLKIKYIYK